MRTKLLKKFFILFTLLNLFGMVSGTSQTLNKPVPADNPNQPGNSVWGAACATTAFNDYFVDFSWNTPLVNSNNIFILELSDANGSFSNPTELATDATKNTTFNFNFQFSLSTTTRGEGYKMRVRSTSPAIIGAESDAFPMYFIDFNSPLLISPNGDGNVPTGGMVEICDGNSVLLAPHNIPNPNTYQYNWYRSGTLLPEKGPSLTINQPGIYHLELDYGSICSGSANTLSNDITVSLGNSLGIALNPPAKTNLCAGETIDLVANIINQGLTYTWYKDNVAITAPSVDNDTFTVDASVAGFEGNYQVEIVGTGTCLERSTGIAITNAGNFTVTNSLPGNVVMLPAENKTLSVSASVSPVSYQWYRNGAQIPGATNTTLVVNEIGTYYAQVTLSGGACASTSKNSEVTTVVTPNTYELITSYTSTYESCANSDITLGVSQINGILADGSSIDVTADLISDFGFQWQKDGTNVSGATSQNISLASTTENGTYILNAALGAITINSNALPIQLIVNDLLIINATSLTSCNATDPITLSTPTDLSGESFEWFHNGNSINNTYASIDVTELGAYKLVVYKNGCPLNSNELVIAPLDESLITLDNPTNVIFPEGGSKTINANGGTAYRWFDINNVLLSSTSSFTIDEEGDYILIANIDACEITKQISATFLDTFKIPNVITVNGDGLNDQWILPNIYSRNAEVNVTIYNDQGIEVFNQFDYQNNWPQSSTSFPKQNMVFFYKIKNAKEVLKQGTITVIR